MITRFTNSDHHRKIIHDLIPGGAHTYSKGDDQFPAISPAAIKRGEGAYLWDIDDNKFLDCSMGLTSVSLGHAYGPVNEAIRKELENGVNFQRPSYLEKIMAETFLNLVPAHDMIKFAKNGSSVTTAAVKLARAFTGRKIVVFPSDHPFYSYDDWFIGKTACSKGVPEEFLSLSKTFVSTDLSSLEEIFRLYPNQIACVITEPEKSHIDSPNYLASIQKICKEEGALFIMDEMITGFKTDFPGSMKKFNIVPDMTTWGKGIANGFSFCALTGKKEVMELGGIRDKGAEKVFLISSTNGGETISLAACIATIHEFKTQSVIQHNHSIGKYFSDCANTLIRKSQLDDYIEVISSAWMPFFIFKNRDKNICTGMRTLMLQEMIKRGVLFQGIFIPCFSHKKEDVDFFMEALSESITVYTQALETGYARFLVGEPTQSVFRKIL